MTPESISNIHIKGKGKLNITRGGITVILDESGAPRESVDNGKIQEVKKRFYPQGTLPSLRPLLRSLFDSGFDDDAYWARLDDEVTMGPQKAINKLRNAGRSCMEVAEALVLSDPKGRENIQFGNIDKSQIEAKIAEVFNKLLPFYQNK